MLCSRLQNQRNLISSSKNTTLYVYRNYKVKVTIRQGSLKCFTSIFAIKDLAVYYWLIINLIYNKVYDIQISFSQYTFRKLFLTLFPIHSDEKGTGKKVTKRTARLNPESWCMILSHDNFCAPLSKIKICRMDPEK